jgi:hypothetical protein
MKLALVATLLAAALRAGAPTGDPAAVERTHGLVAFWTFGEEKGPRMSRGTKENHPLETVGPEPTPLDTGPYSGRSLHFAGRSYLRIPYARLGGLNISGKDARVSMFAVVRMDELKRGSTIAGIWSEGKGAFDDSGTRQYAMLLNMPMYGGKGQLTPHVSGVGGHSRRADGSALPWCVDYAANVTPLPMGRWVTLAFTYDGRWIRAYYDGKMEARTVDPTRDNRADTYFTKEGPDGAHRGINPYFYDKGIFSYDPVKHAETKPGGGADFTVAARYAVGSMLGEALKGALGGLAVFNRALTDEEVAALHASAGVDRLNAPR